MTLRRGFGYDAYGRLTTATHPSSLSAKYEYNPRGYVSKILEGANALVSYTAMNARGSVKSATYGNGVGTTWTYDDGTGRVSDIDTTRGTTTFQVESYGWRSDGLLETRESGTDEEDFGYDGFGRLQSATAYLDGASTAGRTLSFDYDKLGNLKTKTSDVTADADSTSYTYGTGTVSPTRLTGVTLDGVATTLAYDASGHVTGYDAATGDDTAIAWNGRGLPSAVRLGPAAAPTAQDEFRYGPDGERYYRKITWQEETTDADTQQTTTRTRTAHGYRVGGYERVVGDSHADHAMVEKTRAGAALHVRRRETTASTPTTAFEYVHADHLGSTAASTDATGASLLSLAHDPYGTRREADWSAQLADADVLGIGAGQDDGRTRRGFTGHEQLARTGLVHMGARLYDPRIGRFPSPDPVVSEPSSGQAWNLYSYVGNSPMSYVDPTGMFRAGAGCGTVYLCQNDGGGAGGGFTDETLTRTTAHVTSVIVWRPVYASYSFPGWGLTGIGGDRDYGRRLRGFRGGPRVATRRAFVGTPFTRLETRTQAFISARGSSPADGPIPVAFVGGAGDREYRIVKKVYERNQGSGANMYFEHDRRGRADLDAWIRDLNARGIKPIAIGHSWGAVSAARVVADGAEVSELRTVDGVGHRFRRKRFFERVAQYAEVWNNYDSTNRDGTPGNRIAWLGGRWNDSPAPYATNHYKVSQDHVRICEVYCVPIPRAIPAAP